MAPRVISPARTIPANHAPARGKAERVALWLTGLSALSAFGGAWELLIWQEGNEYLPLSLLQSTPFQSFLVPGLLLGLAVGGTSFVAVWALARRLTWARECLVLAGGVLTGWLAGELALLRVFSWLHVFYGALGLTMMALGLLLLFQVPSLRGRWIVGVTAAESLGYMAPALAGILSASSATGPSGLWVTAAGFLEGYCLGFGQATCLPWAVNRRHFALVTGLAACGAWGSAFGLMKLVTAPLPWPVKGPAFLIVALGALAAIGTAQWWVLPPTLRSSRSWIGWTAAAWMVALPMSLLPRPLVDERTPLLSLVVLWCLGGVLMAHVTAWGTWFGVVAMARESGAREAGVP